MNNQRGQDYVSVAVGHVQTTRLPSYMLRATRSGMARNKRRIGAALTVRRGQQEHTVVRVNNHVTGQRHHGSNGSASLPVTHWEQRQNLQDRSRSERFAKCSCIYLQWSAISKQYRGAPVQKGSRITCASAPGRQPGGLVLA